MIVMFVLVAISDINENYTKFLMYCSANPKGRLLTLQVRQLFGFARQNILMLVFKCGILCAAISFLLDLSIPQ